MSAAILTVHETKIDAYSSSFSSFSLRELSIPLLGYGVECASVSFLAGVTTRIKEMKNYSAWRSVTQDCQVFRRWVVKGLYYQTK